MLALPYGAADTGPICSAPRRMAGVQRAMTRKKPREMRADRDRTDAGTAAAVRNTKRLVQIQMRHVGAERSRRGQTDQRIQIRAVDIDLAAAAWTMSQISLIRVSNTPCVDG